MWANDKRERNLPSWLGVTFPSGAGGAGGGWALQPLMILKPTIIIIRCFLFMSTASPRLVFCFRVPQLLLQLWEGAEGTGQGRSPWGLSMGSHPAGQTREPWPFTGSLCAWRPQGPRTYWSSGGREKHSSAQEAMQFSVCPEQRGKAGEGILLQPGHWIVGEPGHPGCSALEPWSSCQGLGDRIDGLLSSLVCLPPTGHWVTESGFSWSVDITW